MQINDSALRIRQISGYLKDLEGLHMIKLPVTFKT